MRRCAVELQSGTISSTKHTYHHLAAPRWQTDGRRSQAPPASTGPGGCHCPEGSSADGGAYVPYGSTRPLGPAYTCIRSAGWSSVSQETDDSTQVICHSNRGLTMLTVTMPTHNTLFTTVCGPECFCLCKKMFVFGSSLNEWISCTATMKQVHLYVCLWWVNALALNHNMCLSLWSCAKTFLMS